MYIINPMVVQDYTGKILSFFGLKYVVYFRYAEERESRTMRYSVSFKTKVKRFRDYDESLIYARKLKRDIDKKLDPDAPLTSRFGAPLVGIKVYED